MELCSIGLLASRGTNTPSAQRGVLVLKALIYQIAHYFRSKESIHIQVLAHALNGDPNAARFLSPDSPDQAPQIAFDIMQTKLDTYLTFNKTFPGYGGYLPWFTTNSTPVQPTWDWVNRVPSLDNGEMLWAAYGAVQVLESSSNQQFQELGARWQDWLDYTASNAARIFYSGTGTTIAAILDEISG